MLLKFKNKLFQKYASCDPSRSLQEKEVNMEKQKVYTAILPNYFIRCWLAPFKTLKANNFFVGYCPNSKLFRPAGNVRNFCDLCY